MDTANAFCDVRRNVVVVAMPWSDSDETGDSDSDSDSNDSSDSSSVSDSDAGSDKENCNSSGSKKFAFKDLLATRGNTASLGHNATSDPGGSKEFAACYCEDAAGDTAVYTEAMSDASVRTADSDEDSDFDPEDLLLDLAVEALQRTHGSNNLPLSQNGGQDFDADIFAEYVLQDQDGDYAKVSWPSRCWCECLEPRALPRRINTV